VDTLATGEDDTVEDTDGEATVEDADDDGTAGSQPPKTTNTTKQTKSTGDRLTNFRRRFAGRRRSCARATPLYRP